MSVLRFYPGTHTYWYGGQSLESVTTFVGRFFSPFNAKEIARKLAKIPSNKAKKRGVRYFLKEWSGAADHGTRVHGLLEQYAKRDPLVSYSKTYIEKPYCETRDILKFLSGISFLSTLDQTRLLTETKIFNTDYGLAGTVDLTVYNEDGSINIIDWKTNKKIKKTAYKNKCGLPPVDHLPDANFFKYALQLSIYAYMLEASGKTISTLTLVHLEEDKYTAYDVPYLKEDVEALLNESKEQ